ncbi:MAG: hypothetical protein JST81_05960 [Bacteroidetes bacterium]|nr:hypothetical protein [Bacteroidota bacterium]
MKKIFYLVAAIVAMYVMACNSKKASESTHLLIDTKMLDSIKLHSDSMYEKPYMRSDWVTATYFVSRKDSTITQLMKDSFGNIRQVIIERNKVRIYVNQYYPNGQQQYKVKLDAFGQFDGPAEEYYENGNLKRTGTYKSGLHIGEWKNYDESGVYTFTQIYNGDGQETEKHKD